jgi:hypothetical protein
MASYTNLVVREAVEFRGVAPAANVVEVTVLTVPHGVAYAFRQPRAGWTPELAKAAAENGAAYIEQVFTNNPNCAGIEFIENQTPAGLLEDTWVIYVSSDSGNSSLSFQLPATTFDQADATAQINALAAQLNAAEA